MPNKPKTHQPPPAARRHTPPERQRPSAHKRGYGKRWAKLRTVVLAEEPLCRECRKANHLIPATHVDHILAREKGGTDARTNLQPLCASCHSRKTAREDGGLGNPRRG